MKKYETDMERTLAPIISKVNWADVARNGMGRTPQWFYQHVHENIVNGKPSMFTEQERTKLRDYLMALGTKIIATAEKL